MLALSRENKHRLIRASTPTTLRIRTFYNGGRIFKALQTKTCVMRPTSILQSQRDTDY